MISKMSKQLFSYLKTSKAKKALLSYSIFIVSVIAVFFAIPKNYALAINGEVVGVAKDMDEVNSVIENVEAKVSEVLGYDYSLSDSVEVTGSTASIDDNNLESVLLDSVSEIENIYTLQVDGQDVAACETEEEIRMALDGILDTYSRKHNGSASFVSTISVRNGYVPVSTKTDIEGIKSLIDPDSGAFPVKIRIVEYTSSERLLPFGSEYVCDDSEYIGTTKVIEPGVSGSAEVISRNIYLNDKLVETSEVSVKEIVSPIPEIISIGTAEYPYYISKGYYIWPARGMLTSYFGFRGASIGSSNHQGLDIAAYTGYPITAADGGEVIFSGYQNSYGNIVKILHDNGDVTWYAHCSSLAVSVGDKVGQGQVIAYMGETGVASGPHLHFEIRIGGTTPVDPLNYLTTA